MMKILFGCSTMVLFLAAFSFPRNSIIPLRTNKITIAFESKYNIDSELTNHFKKVAAIATLGLTMLTSQPILTHAAVGEGDLPDGFLAFSKLLKFQVILFT